MFRTKQERCRVDVLDGEALVRPAVPIPLDDPGSALKRRVGHVQHLPRVRHDNAVEAVIEVVEAESLIGLPGDEPNC